MAVTAAQLSKTSTHSPIITETVNAQIQLINSALKSHARGWGKNTVEYGLPTMFPFPGLAKKDAQLLVYTSIIKHFVKAGFAVRLLLEPERSSLYVQWTTDLDTAEIEAMKTTIRSYRINDRNELAKFLDQKDGVQGLGRPKDPQKPRPKTAKPAPATIPDWAITGPTPNVPLPPAAAAAVAANVGAAVVVGGSKK